jgi:hypothetical protein
MYEYFGLARNAKNPIQSQNEFQWITKHMFWQDYSLHMRLAFQVRHFEPIEIIVYQMV